MGVLKKWKKKHALKKALYATLAASLGIAAALEAVGGASGLQTLTAASGIGALTGAFRFAMNWYKWNCPKHKRDQLP